MTDQTIQTGIPAQPVTSAASIKPHPIPLGVKIAICWLALMIFVAITAQWISPYVFTSPDLRNRLSPPGDAAHWLGTDELGRDVLSRLMISIQISMLIAFGASLISAVFGTTLGFLAAHFRVLSSSSC